MNIRQQDDAKPRQTNMVMNLVINLDFSFFLERMLVIKVRRDDSLATSSTYMNHCDSFVWGYIKDVVFKPMPENLQDLKDTIKREFQAIPEVMVRKGSMG
jgi:hypothetical protein